MAHAEPLTTRERPGLLAAFTVFGLFWGAWSAVLPDVRSRSGLSDSALGLALGAIAVAALPAMPVAGRLMDRYGARRLLPASLLAFGLVVVLLGQVASPVALVAGLLLLGAVTGALDVVVNTATAAHERLQGARLMTAGHGFFSLGVLGGAVTTGIARDAGAGPGAVLGVAGAAIVLCALAQPAYRLAPQPEVAAGRRGLAPLLLGLGVVVACSFLVEDAVSSWSALHLERSLRAEPWVSGLAPGLFAGAMAAGRLGAAALSPARDALVVGLAGVVTAAGLLVLALAPTAPVALAGAVVAGTGVSVLAPTLLSAVGARSPAGRQGADLALVTAFGYAGFVVGPLLVGLLSAATTLPTALAALAVLPAVVALLGPALLRRPAEASHPAAGAR